MSTETALFETALSHFHIAQHAKMVPFAGYNMPVQYPMGVLKEHQHTREAAGLFDVSHMGQVEFSGDGVAKALETVLPTDVLGLNPGNQVYSLLLNPDGGIRDDLMLANYGTPDSPRYIAVFNAATKHDDIAYLREVLPSSVKLQLHDRALLALQGPQARDVLPRLAADASELSFMQVAEMEVAGCPAMVSCSGYTGEDGYEISVANKDAVKVAQQLLAMSEVELIGLGARDSLRLEAGLCLYGHDIDQGTTPVSAGLRWAIATCRRPGGERAGGYAGFDVIETQMEQGSERLRVLLKPEGRAPVREGTPIINAQGETVGEITSGGFGPTVGGPVAMGYVTRANLKDDLFVELRKKRVALARQKGSFVPQRYHR